MNIAELINSIKGIQKEYPKEEVDFELTFKVKADLEKERTFKRVACYNACVGVRTQNTEELRYSLISKLKNTLEGNEDIQYNLTITENCFDEEEEDDDYCYEEGYFVVDYHTNIDYHDYCVDDKYFIAEYYDVLKQEKGIFNELNDEYITITISLDAKGRIKLNSNKEDLFEKVKSFNNIAKELGIERDYTVSEITITLEDFEEQLKANKVIIEDIIEYNNLANKGYKLDTWLIYDSKKENAGNSGFYITFETNSMHPHYINNKGIDCNDFLISANLLTREYWYSGISPYTSVVLKSEKGYYNNTSISNSTNTTTNLRRCFNEICENKLTEEFTNSFMEINLSKLKNMDFLDIKDDVKCLTRADKLLLVTENENIASLEFTLTNPYFQDKGAKLKENFIAVLEYLWRYA